MPDQADVPPETSVPGPMPQTTALLLSTLADLHNQEAGAEEDVYRTLPFFGTALGFVVAALAWKRAVITTLWIVRTGEELSRLVTCWVV